MADTPTTDLDKVEKLIVVLAQALLLGLLNRRYIVHDEQFRSGKTRRRKARSLFREGSNMIRWAIFRGVGRRKFGRLLLCSTKLETMG